MIFDSPWLTVKEAAAYARVDRWTLFELRRQGRLHMGGSERKRLIHREHLDRQIEAGYPVLEVIEAPSPSRRRKGLEIINRL